VGMRETHVGGLPFGTRGARFRRAYLPDGLFFTGARIVAFCAVLCFKGETRADEHTTPMQQYLMLHSLFRNVIHTFSPITTPRFLSRQ